MLQIVAGTVILTTAILLIWFYGRGQCLSGEFAVGDPINCKPGIEIVRDDFRPCFEDEDRIYHEEERIYARLYGRRHIACKLQDFEPSLVVYNMTVSEVPLCRLTPRANRDFGFEPVPFRVERLNGVIFFLSSDPFPDPEHHLSHCSYGVTIDFEQDPIEEQLHFEFAFENFRPLPGEVDGRYDAILTMPEAGKPFAALVYDREVGKLTYLVTNFVN